MDMNHFGVGCFGFLIGWFTYYINRYRKSDLQFSDITTLVGVLGGASASALLTSGGPDPERVSYYGIGLVAGYFGYLLFLLILVAWSDNFTLDWFLDGRRKEPMPPYMIPDGTALTVRPAAQAVVLPAPIVPASVAARTYHANPQATRIRDVSGDDQVTLKIILKPEKPIPVGDYQVGKGISPEQFAALHSSNRDAVDRVVRYVESRGLHVANVNAAQHALKVTGTYARAQDAFRPEALGVYRDNKTNREYVGRTGSIFIPSDIANDIVAVMGFDSRPIARPHLQIHPEADGEEGYVPSEVADRYGFPVGSGAGQTIGLIELGGGYDPDSVAAYFTAKAPARTGTLQYVPVGATNTQDHDKGDQEVQLDIEVVGCVAPAANIRVYFCPATAVGFHDGIQAAIDDKCSIISISWGAYEGYWSKQDKDAFDLAFQSAAAKNITVCVSSGDAGAIDDNPTGLRMADFPAVSPNVLACGGTMLPENGAEIAWNEGSESASGGGYSAYFPRPPYQICVTGQWRGVPDVAGNAAKSTGYAIVVNGDGYMVGGTSAVAPLYAGLIARINQQLGKNVGFINSVLYRSPTAFNDITSGCNNGYSSATGWDPVTGLGSPKGNAIFAAIKAAI